MRVPGAKVAGPDTAGNLLNVALWSLGEQGLIELEQLRPVEVEKVQSMGGRSFARATVLDRPSELPGLEGALLAAGRARHEQGWLRGIDDAIAKLISGDDENGVRGLVLAVGLHSYSPWTTVAGYCLGEVSAAGLVEVKGRLMAKPVISDSAGVEELRARDGEIVAARTAYREREPELDGAVLGDCLHAVHWAYRSPD